MEPPEGPREGPGVPKSTVDGLGAVSSHPPQTPERQAPEAPLLFPRPSNSWERSLAADPQLAGALQGSLQEQLAPGNAKASPKRKLVSGLIEAMRASSNGPNETNGPLSNGGNP